MSNGPPPLNRQCFPNDGDKLLHPSLVQCIFMYIPKFVDLELSVSFRILWNSVNIPGVNDGFLSFDQSQNKPAHASLKHFNCILPHDKLLTAMLRACF